MIVAIDPANVTGVCWDGQVTSYNFTPKAATKKRSKEPEYLRFGKLWDVLWQLKREHDVRLIVCENATGFERGKAAIVVSNQYRGVVKAFCAISGIPYIGVEPGDLKYFATGKRGAEKEEVIAAANALGYIGHDDNEADAFMLYHWALENTMLKYEKIDDCPF